MEVTRPNARTPVRFGVFEVDLLAGELRRNGSKVKLQEQPFQLLVMLLEHPGEVVTREEIQQKLWPSDTFVDFEHSINAAVKRLREALDDSADNPRFVETLHRRGYRFIAPVDVGAIHELPLPITGPRAIHESPLRRRWVVAVAGGVVVAVVAVLFALNVAGLRKRLAAIVVGAQHAAPLPKIESIAVLPLENLSHDPEQEYFADGMTDALITNLGKIRALRVISRTTAMHFKGTKKTLPEIARELNVDAVVEGSVLRSGNRVRVTANLLHAPTDRHLWANSYESELRDVLVLQGEVARAIAEEVRIKLTPEEQARLTPTRPVNPEAFEAYLRGRYFWNRRTEEALKKGIEFFGQALEKDPAYALAYAGLADSYCVLGDYSFLPPKEAIPRAKAGATKALELDETSAEAHTSLAFVKHRYEWDWLGAEREFKRAIELNPNYATAHHWYSDYLEQMGRHDEAITEIKRAQQLDPLSLIINAVVGRRFRSARRYDEAVEQLRKTLEMDPNFAVAHWLLGDAYEQKGKYESAIAEYQKGRSASGGSVYLVAALGHVYAAAGNRREALKILGELKELSKRTYVSPLSIGSIYNALGDKDQALEWLEKAYQDRAAGMTDLKLDPMPDPLRSDPRFQNLLRRMNFPP